MCSIVNRLPLSSPRIRLSSEPDIEIMRISIYDSSIELLSERADHGDGLNQPAQGDCHRQQRGVPDGDQCPSLHCLMARQTCDRKAL